MSEKQPPSYLTAIPFSLRWKLWLIAWSVGLVAAGFPNPALIFYFWLFPIGLLKVIGWQDTGYDSGYFVGWLVYIPLSVLALIARPRLLYFTLYLILCFLLLLNIVGCQQMNAQMKDMH